MDKLTSKHYTYHYVLKYSDKAAPPAGTIQLHDKVIKTHGCAWFGKFGKQVENLAFSILKNQIEEGIRTYLFLVSRSHNSISVSAGFLKEINRKVDKVKYIPSYYQKRRHNILTWFKISRRLSLRPDILQILQGHSSKLPVAFTIYKTIAGGMLATLSKDKRIEEFVITNPCRDNT